MRRAVWLAAWIATGVAAPLFTGSAQAPSLAPSAAELLVPGTRVEEIDLRNGGFVRARGLAIEGGALVVTGSSGSRTVPGVQTAGFVRSRVMWLGTDHQGRDMLARLAAGARRSLSVAALAIALATTLGVAIGLAAAFSPAWIASALALVVDAALSLPRLLLILILGVALRRSWGGAALAIGFASWMELARLSEADARGLARRPFAQAARAAGAGAARIAVTHVLPNLMPVLASAIPTAAAEAILLESTMSFLGFGGVDGSSWGRMIADGLRLMPGGWWMSVAPGTLLVATAVAVSVLARGGRGDRRALELPNSGPARG